MKILFIISLLVTATACSTTCYEVTRIGGCDDDGTCGAIIQRKDGQKFKAVLDYPVVEEQVCK